MTHSTFRPIGSVAQAIIANLQDKRDLEIERATIVADRMIDDFDRRDGSTHEHHAEAAQRYDALADVWLRLWDQGYVT